MFIVEDSVKFDDVNSLLGEAQSYYVKLKVFDKEEQLNICQKLLESNENLAIALGSLIESIPLNEFIVKHVSSKGEITKTKDLKTRQRQAFQTTGLSKSARRRIALKAAKTKRANPSKKIKTARKFKKALAKRKSIFGLK